jgi:hypothetical protein
MLGKGNRNQYQGQQNTCPHRSAPCTPQLLRKDMHNISNRSRSERLAQRFGNCGRKSSSNNDMRRTVRARRSSMSPNSRNMRGCIYRWTDGKAKLCLTVTASSQRASTPDVTARLRSPAYRADWRRRGGGGHRATPT